MTNKNDINPEYSELKAHVGHRVEVVTYGKDVNVSVECIDCSAVLRSEDKYNDQ